MKTLIVGLAATLLLTTFWLLTTLGAAAVEAVRAGKSRRD